jgi:hypothetical protein
MNMLKKYFLVPVVLILFFLSGVSAFAADKLEIIHKDGLLTVSADDVSPENIFLELGEVCEIDIITHGDVFPEKGVSMNLKDMPIKEAVKRLVRTCSLKNYLMDFKKDQKGQSQLVKIDLYMGGTGQRYLTQGRGKSGQKAAGKKVKTEKSTRSDSVDKQKSTRSDSADKQKKNKMPYKSSFSKDTDFEWDGSAPIAFPEYKGELSEGEFGWEDSAKDFAENTMDMVPPGVRGTVSEQLGKISDQICKEQGTDKVTSDIMAEAINRMAKQAKMPQSVMDLMPKSIDDFDTPKIPIDPDQLNQE